MFLLKLTARRIEIAAEACKVRPNIRCSGRGFATPERGPKLGLNLVRIA